jgi:hypothetical protein
MAAPVIILAETDIARIILHLALPVPAIAAIGSIVKAQEAFVALESAGLLLEAAKVLALALPKRQAVWWACMCALHTAPPNLPENHRKARETAEIWVRQQTDAARRAAMRLAEQTNFDTPEAWVAVAAFWSGESLSADNEPIILPPPHLTGLAVGGAIGLSSVRMTFDRRLARLQRFLESGRDIATGGAGRLTAESPA